MEKYELIESQRIPFWLDVSCTMSTMHNDLFQSGKDLTDTAAVARSVSKRFEQIMEGRRQALEQLTRIMVEIVSPLPQRFFAWAAEHNLEFSGTKKCGLIPNELRPSVTSFLQTLFTREQPYNEMKVFLAVSSEKLRARVQKLVESQRNVQLEMGKIAQYFCNNFISKCDAAKVQMIASFVANVFLCEGNNN